LVFVGFSPRHFHTEFGGMSDTQERKIVIFDTTLRDGEQ
jgi:hypothetical protein